jgi:hypothetical protein
MVRHTTHFFELRLATMTFIGTIIIDEEHHQSSRTISHPT